MPRPKLPPHEERSRFVGVRMTEAEVQTIDAARGAMPRARFIREAALRASRAKDYSGKADGI